MEQTVNTFSGGLQIDTHPSVSGGDVLSDALNATFITMNGNEVVLLNDMGNSKVTKLPPGFEPVGMKEYGGVIYIASYNPISNLSQIGSFPSPVITYSKENTKYYTLESLDYNFINVHNTEVILIDEEEKKELKSLKAYTLLYPLTDDTVLHAGDNFTIWSKHKEIFPNNDPSNDDPIRITNFNNIYLDLDYDMVYSPKNKIYTFSMGVMNSQNLFVDITHTLKRFDINDGNLLDLTGKSELYKFNSGYFIRNSDEKNLPTYIDTYTYKLIGPLFIKLHLNHINKIDFDVRVFWSDECNDSDPGEFENPDIPVDNPDDPEIDPDSDHEDEEEIPLPFDFSDVYFLIGQQEQGETYYNLIFVDYQESYIYSESNKTISLKLGNVPSWSISGNDVVVTEDVDIVRIKIGTRNPSNNSITNNNSTKLIDCTYDDETLNIKVKNDNLKKVEITCTYIYDYSRDPLYHDRFASIFFYKDEAPPKKISPYLEIMDITLKENESIDLNQIYLNDFIDLYYGINVSLELLTGERIINIDENNILSALELLEGEQSLTTTVKLSWSGEEYEEGYSTFDVTVISEKEESKCLEIIVTQNIEYNCPDVWDEQTLEKEPEENNENNNLEPEDDDYFTYEEIQSNFPIKFYEITGKEKHEGIDVDKGIEIVKNTGKSLVEQSKYNKEKNVYNAIVTNVYNINPNNDEEIEYSILVPVLLSKDKTYYSKELSYKGTINPKLIGSGLLELSSWRFFNNYDSTELTYSFINYPRYNELFVDLYFKFINVYTKETYRYPVDELNFLTIPSGRNTITLDWDEIGLVGQSLYNVEIYYSIEKASGDKYKDKVVDSKEFILTTDLFNSCYNSSSDNFVHDYGNPYEGREKTVIDRLRTINFDLEISDINYKISNPTYKIWGGLESEFDLFPEIKSENKPTKIKYELTRKVTINTATSSDLKLKIKNEELYPSSLKVTEYEFSNVGIQTEKESDNVTVSIGKSDNKYIVRITNYDEYSDVEWTDNPITLKNPLNKAKISDLFVSENSRYYGRLSPSTEYYNNEKGFAIVANVSKDKSLNSQLKKPFERYRINNNNRIFVVSSLTKNISECYIDDDINKPVLDAAYMFFTKEVESSNQIWLYQFGDRVVYFLDENKNRIAKETENSRLLWRTDDKSWAYTNGLININNITNKLNSYIKDIIYVNKDYTGTELTSKCKVLSYTEPELYSENFKLNLQIDVNNIKATGYPSGATGYPESNLKFKYNSQLKSVKEFKIVIESSQLFRSLLKEIKESSEIENVYINSNGKCILLDNNRDRLNPDHCYKLNNNKLLRDFRFTRGHPMLNGTYLILCSSKYMSDINPPYTIYDGGRKLTINFDKVLVLDDE